ATALINSSNDLNQAQKNALKQQVQNATTVAGVNNVKQTAQELNNAMTQLKQGIADKEQTKADGNFVNAEPNKKQAYDEAVQNAESIIAGLTNPTINKDNVSSATQAVTSSKNALDGVERLAQDKQTAGNSLNHLDHLKPA
ncbi:hypothetical protein MU476_15590, partial [Staphylococcus aureus]